MPSTSRRQQRFMYAEKERIQRGETPKTGMTLSQINDLTRLDKKAKKGSK